MMAVSGETTVLTTPGYHTPPAKATTTTSLVWVNLNVCSLASWMWWYDSVSSRSSSLLDCCSLTLSCCCWGDGGVLLTVAVPLVTMASMVAAFVEIKLLNLSFLSATLAAAEPLSRFSNGSTSEVAAEGPLTSNAQFPWHQWEAAQTW